MNNSAFKYIIRVLGQKILALAVFLLGSFGYINLLISIFFIFVVLITLISLLYLNKAHPKVLEKRNQIDPDTPNTDKILLLLFWLLNFFGIYFIAGTSAKDTNLDLFTFGVGLFVLIIATLITTSALAINPFLENTAVIQSNHYVVKEGVYKIVRHPTYFASILSSLGVGLIFQSIPVFIVMLLIWIILVIRTYLEDKMLIENLPGYQEYSEEVKDRLVPFMW